MKKDYLIVPLVICLFLVLAPVASALGGGEGWITIQCNVNGASVRFDDAYKGTIEGGSLTVPVYTTGAPYHSFTVEKAGYTSYTGELSMPAEGQTRTYYATLNPVSTPTPVPPVNYGSVYIDSSPGGAQIYFNGDYRGLSPLTIRDVWPGQYTVNAELNGYRTYTTTTPVSAGLQSNVYCPLEKIVTSGALYILSSPSNSNVYLDAVYKGTTPLTLSNLAPGTHIVQIDHAGYYDWKSTATVSPGGTNTVSATLNPLPVSTVGWLYVSSSPGGASVTLDGNAVGQTPGSGSLKLDNIPAGEHTVALSLAGYHPYSVYTSVTANTVSEVSAILQPIGPTSAKGGLSMSSTPPGANIFLDNNFIGISPLTLNDISAGNHLVTFHLEGYNANTITTTVNAGATSTVSAALVPVSPPTRKSALLPVTAAAALLIVCIVAMRKR